MGKGLSSGTGVEVVFGCFRFDLLFGVAVGDGVDEAFFFLADGVGAGVGVAFFFRCLRLGVGDGSKAFFIFVPSDCSAACVAQTGASSIATTKSHFMIRAVRLTL